MPFSGSGERFGISSPKKRRKKKKKCRRRITEIFFRMENILCKCRPLTKSLEGITLLVSE